MSEDGGEILGANFGRWDVVMPDIHQAVFGLPNETASYSGRVRGEAERMYNEALALHNRKLDNSIRQKAILSSLTCVQSAFRRATFGEEFNDNIFILELARGLAEKISEASIIKEETKTGEDYELELERASELLIEIIKGKIGEKWEELVEQAELQALENVS